MNLELINSKSKKKSVYKVKIQYDMLPKCFHTCKLQGHVKDECKSLYLKLKKLETEEKKKGEGKEEKVNIHI